MGFSLAAALGCLVAVASLVSEHGLWGAWASAVAALGLWITGSELVGHGLSCSTECGIFPNQRLNPCLLQWQADLLQEGRGTPSRAQNWSLV